MKNTIFSLNIQEFPQSKLIITLSDVKKWDKTYELVNLS